MFHRTPAHSFCRLFPWLTSPRYLSTGEPGFLHQRSHQGQPAECDALLLRPSAAADIRADGKGLISPVPALRTLLGLNQPKKGQLHLDLIFIIKDPRKTKTKPEHWWWIKCRRPQKQAGGVGVRVGRDVTRMPFLKKNSSRVSVIPSAMGFFLVFCHPRHGVRGRSNAAALQRNVVYTVTGWMDGWMNGVINEWVNGRA